MGEKIKKMNFKSEEDYRKWLAFGHIHGIFKKTKGHVKVLIGGKPHKVNHQKGRRKNTRKNKKSNRK